MVARPPTVHGGLDNSFYYVISFSDHVICRKIQILAKNPNFAKKSKFCQKIQYLPKNPKFVKKSKNNKSNNL
jgi:hypothetical protein